MVIERYFVRAHLKRLAEVLHQATGQLGFGRPHPAQPEILPPSELVRSFIAYRPDGTPHLVEVHRCARTGTVLRMEHSVVD